MNDPTINNEVASRNAESADARPVPRPVSLRGTVRAASSWVRLGMFMVSAVSGVGLLRAQEPESAPSGEWQPLALKEQMIRDRFERFTDRVFRLREQLSDTEPENAARLARVLEQAGALGLTEQLEQLVRDLNESGGVAQALESQGQWIQDANRILDILLERDAHNEERKQEIDRLEAIREEVSRLLAEEQRLREASAQSAITGRLQRQLQQALQQLQGLRAKQEQLSSSSQADTAGKGAASEAPEQRSLAEQTRDLSERLNQESELAPDPSADGPAAQKGRQGASAAAAKIGEGAQAMNQAGQALETGDSGQAATQQNNAVDSLRAAERELESALKELQEANSLAEQSEKQRGVSGETGALAERMKGANDAGPRQPGDDQGGSPKGGQGGEPEGGQGEPGSKGNQGGQQGQKGSPGGGGSTPPTPGQQNVERAQEEMERATDLLRGERAADATRRQDQAIEELEQTQESLEKLLNQLRQEERQETLRDLEARLRDMLAKQKSINVDTLNLDGFGPANFQRAEELQLADLAARQRDLGDRADDCAHVLTEDGTTIAFPRIVGQVVLDMRDVAGRLEALQTGPLTQTIQTEILDTLEQIVEALQKMQQENEQQGGGQAGSGENAALLPPSAELKLLRSSQLRINQRTAIVEQGRQAGTETPAVVESALKSMVVRQNECAAMAKEMREKLTVP